MNEWRKAGPLGVLFDVISSICTPQARELLENFQREEAEQLGNSNFIPKEVKKPVKTRWNSYFDCFERAVALRVPLDDYITSKTNEYDRGLARRRPGQRQEQSQARLFVQEGGLTAKDWATITEYIELLQPFKEATTWLEGRGNAGLHGAIWEVIPTFEWLIKRLEALRVRVEAIDYNDVDAPEDHLKTNLNLAIQKINQYYVKLEDAPAYYAAVRLHPAYKDWLDTTWKVPPTYDEDSPHPREGWLTANDKGFQQLWARAKDIAMLANSPNSPRSPPSKRQQLDYAASRTEFMRATMREAESSKDDADEYEIWRTELALDPSHKLAQQPIAYWLSKEQQYPTLARFALDLLSIPAAAADCERTFSELADLLGVRRLRMKPDLLSALQSLRSWKRIGIEPSKTPYKCNTIQDRTICQLNQYVSQFGIDSDDD